MLFCLYNDFFQKAHIRDEKAEAVLIIMTSRSFRTITKAAAPSVSPSVLLLGWFAHLCVQVAEKTQSVICQKSCLDKQRMKFSVMHERRKYFLLGRAIVGFSRGSTLVEFHFTNSKPRIVQKNIFPQKGHWKISNFKIQMGLPSPSPPVPTPRLLCKIKKKNIDIDAPDFYCRPKSTCPRSWRRSSTNFNTWTIASSSLRLRKSIRPSSTASRITPGPSEGTGTRACPARPWERKDLNRSY